MTEIPKRKSKSRNLVKSYVLMMTPEMKDDLDKLKAFKDIDVPEWIRKMIQDGIKEIT